MAMAGRKTFPISLGLVEAVGVELPKPSVGLLKFSNFSIGLARRAETAVALAEHVVGRANFDQKVSAFIERKGFGVVVSLGGQIAHHHFGRRAGHQFVGDVALAINGRATGVIQPPLVQGHVRAAVAGTKFLHHVGAAVPVRITEGKQRSKLGLGVNIAVGHDRDPAQAL